MRVAWTGPVPSGGGGSATLAGEIIAGLAEAGAEVHCFLEGPSEHLRTLTATCADRVRVSWPAEPTLRWEWDRWYNRNHLAAFVSGQTSRLVNQRQVFRLLADEHASRPFDAWLRFSQLERPPSRRAMPPMVLYPGVHARGELRWHRRERQLARRSERRAFTAAVDLILAVRSIAQRRVFSQASGVVAMSGPFGACLRADHDLRSVPFAVVPACVNLSAFQPGDEPERERQVVLFPSRLSVRKGVEDVVALSHALADLADECEIQVVGDRTQWSDYRQLLNEANPAVLRHLGRVESDEMAALHRRADAVLAPSRYEPFGLSVAEALACGTPVICTDQVGAAADVDAAVCTLVAPGDIAGLETAVRAVLARTADERAQTRARARAEAERLFARERLGRELLAFLRQVSGPAWRTLR